jgi:hypothetical protein
MKRFKYPKFFLFLVIVFLAFRFYQLKDYQPLHDFIINLGFFAPLVAGLFFSYGFTTPFAIALFLILGQNNNILFSALLGGLGALTSDLIIFKFIRKSFADEIKRLSKEKIAHYFDHRIPAKIRKYMLALLGGFIIASPLPDEIGVALLAAAMHVTTRTFIIISYVMNTIGIYIILTIGTAL